MNDLTTRKKSFHRMRESGGGRGLCSSNPCRCSGWVGGEAMVKSIFDPMPKLCLHRRGNIIVWLGALIPTGRGIFQ